MNAQNYGFMNRRYVKTYDCDPLNQCYCGSNEIFGQCCGRKERDRDPPAGITIVRNFFEPNALRALRKKLKALPKSTLGTADTNSVDTKNLFSRQDPARVSEMIITDKASQRRLNNMVCAAIKEKIQPFTQETLTHIEIPHVLYYEKGGKYDAHTDSELFDPVRNQFYQAIDRHLTFLIYLNDGYEGGNLKFNILNYTYTPKAGEALCFPSGHIFAHESTPILRGHKMAIATWGIVEGGVRIGTPVTPKTHIEL